MSERYVMPGGTISMVKSICLVRKSTKGSYGRFLVFDACHIIMVSGTIGFKLNLLRFCCPSNDNQAPATCH